MNNTTSNTPKTNDEPPAFFKAVFYIIFAIAVFHFSPIVTNYFLYPPDSRAVSFPADLELKNLSVQNLEFGQYVVGTLTNTGSRPYGFITVTVRFSDDKDVRVGEDIDNIKNLGAGEVGRFKVAVPYDIPSKYRYDVAEVEATRNLN